VPTEIAEFRQLVRHLCVPRSNVINYRRSSDLSNENKSSFTTNYQSTVTYSEISPVSPQSNNITTAETDKNIWGGGRAVVECMTRDRKVPGSIPGGAKK